MNRIRGLAREPLLHFLLIGVTLFLLHLWRGGSSTSPAGDPKSPANQIVVTQGDIAQMERQFAATWQRPPSDAERKGLVEDFVRNEIYCREALAMGLDRDDAVIRRRLRTKMEFLYEDISALESPSDETLRAFMRSHAESYRSDPQVAFRQVFVNAAKRGSGAEAEARRLLSRLKAGADPESLGDPTMLAAAVPRSTRSEIEAQFGAEFAEHLIALGPGGWTGPLRSTYGLHLVLVRERVEGAFPDLDAVRDAVKRDWATQRQREIKDAAYARLRARYSVAVEPTGTPGTPSASAATPGPSTR